MEGSFSSMAFSKDSIVSWVGPGRRKISVDPHQTMTSRSQPFSSLKFLMSSRICSAISRLSAPVFLLGPSSRVTYSGSKAAGMGSMAASSSLMGSRCSDLSTPAFTALS